MIGTQDILRRLLFPDDAYTRGGKRGAKQVAIVCSRDFGQKLLECIGAELLVLALLVRFVFLEVLVAFGGHLPNRLVSHFGLGQLIRSCCKERGSHNSQGKRIACEGLRTSRML